MNVKLVILNSKWITYSVISKIPLEGIYIALTGTLLQIDSILPANTTEIAGVTGLVYFAGKVAELVLNYINNKDKLWIGLLEENNRLLVSAHKESIDALKEHIITLIKEIETNNTLIQSIPLQIRELQTASERNRADIYKQEIDRMTKGSKSPHTPNNE